MRLGKVKNVQTDSNREKTTYQFLRGTYVNSQPPRNLSGRKDKDTYGTHPDTQKYIKPFVSSSINHLNMSNGNGEIRVGTDTVKMGLAQMLKGGVIVSRHVAIEETESTIVRVLYCGQRRNGEPVVMTSYSETKATIFFNPI
jgi:hypothetical protein